MLVQGWETDEAAARHFECCLVDRPGHPRKHKPGILEVYCYTFEYQLDTPLDSGAQSQSHAITLGDRCNTSRDSFQPV